MPAPLSLDLRRRVVEAYVAGKLTYAQTAAQLAVGEATVSRLLRLEREKKNLEPKPLPGRRPRIDDEGLEHLRGLVEAQPDATLRELAASYEAHKGVKVALCILHRALERLGLSLKKRRYTRVSARPIA